MAEQHATPDLRAILAANVLHYRTLAGRSQTWLAERCGISRTHVVNLEHGRNATSIEVLGALAQALGIRPGDLLNEPERCPTCGQYAVDLDRASGDPQDGSHDA